MKNKPENDLDFIDPIEFSLKNQNVHIGETYPIYGKITDIIESSDGQIILLVNDNVELTLSVEDDYTLSELLSQCFEPGIFVSTIDSLDTNIKGTCTAIVFDRKTQPIIN